MTHDNTIIAALAEKVERLESQVKSDKEYVDSLHRIFAEKNDRIRELEQRLVCIGAKPNGSDGNE